MDPSFDLWPASPGMPPHTPADPTKAQDKLKKPRHRHSPAQLAALNELYEKNEHPALDLRTALAERLGMETKTVNAWFQNKRASSKKRTRGTPYDIPINSQPGSIPSTSHNTPRHHTEFDDFNDDDYSPPDNQYSRSTSAAPDHLRPHSTFYVGNPDHTHFLIEDTMPRRMRMRPTAEQTDELRKLYNVNPHPTTDQRQILAERIGMRYQSITNWFQNQRSLAKKRKEDEADTIVSATSKESGELHPESRTYSAFPPPSTHPSLRLPQHTDNASTSVSMSRRSPSIALSLDERLSRRSSSRTSSTPYSSSTASFSRPRRSRPEPHQLDALKDLFIKTPTPSIEERTALAREIGMDIGKVTNWFRNLRQTARKRTKRPGSGDDDDDDSFSGNNTHSTSVSRSGTPSFNSSASSSSMDMDMDMDDYDMQGIHSDVGSEDEYEEAVTPPPEPAPSLPSASTSSSRIAISHLTLGSDTVSYTEPEKAITAQYSGIKIEDALLLLSFHRHVVH